MVFYSIFQLAGKTPATTAPFVLRQASASHVTGTNVNVQLVTLAYIVRQVKSSSSSYINDTNKYVIEFPHQQLSVLYLWVFIINNIHNYV